jgi:hypothetical protein
MVDNIARVGLAGSRDENQMEKRLTSLRPFTDHRGKTKFCAHCGYSRSLVRGGGGFSNRKILRYMSKENKIVQLVIL